MAVAAGASLSAAAAKERTAPESGDAETSQEDDPRWQPVLALPCLLTVDLPMPHFKVADFLKLQPGSVVATEWRLRQDVPLRVNGTLIAWGEFEGSGTRLAVRLTELA